MRKKLHYKFTIFKIIVSYSNLCMLHFSKLTSLCINTIHGVMVHYSVLDHFARGNLTHAVTARKQISIKFSLMNKSVSPGFI